jgi:hypothetical protein
MIEEIEKDKKEGKLYFSSYLSEVGRNDWPELLLAAAKSGNDVTFGNELRIGGRLNAMGQRKKPGGGFTMVKVPVTAHETLSEGEFNRFYIRALCRRAIEDKVPHVIAYRAKQVEKPRPESIAIEDQPFDPSTVLADLRTNVGVETSSGFPGPNSGMSVKLP